MATKKRTLLSWSSGKDSAWALHILRQQREIELRGLFTTVNSAYQRVAMHAVPKDLLLRQAEALGLPLTIIEIPSPCSNEEYESAMTTFINRAKADGIEYMAFGDLFLADVRAYRESKLKGTGIKPLFPLWGRPTGQLAKEMMCAGVRALITCVDPRLLPASFAGREFDPAFLHDLPASADPCGENGEFHSFVFGGPFFKKRLSVTAGRTVVKDGFVFADIVATSRRGNGDRYG